MTTDAEREAFEAWAAHFPWSRNSAWSGWQARAALPSPQPEPVADDLAGLPSFDSWFDGLCPHTVESLGKRSVASEAWHEIRRKMQARITSDSATIAAKDAEIARLRNYCGASARDYAGTLAALEEAAGSALMENFPRTAKDLRDTSEFMALAAAGKEEPSRWGAELNDAKARITELQAGVERLPRVAALLRALVRAFDAGGENCGRSFRSALAEEAYDLVLSDAPEYVVEFAACDADPFGYLASRRRKELSAAGAALNTGESDAG